MQQSIKSFIITVSTRLSLWQGLLTAACLILVYLAGVHISEALSTSSLFAYFNTHQAYITWTPSRGPLDHYLLEITDTRFLGNSSSRNRITTTRHVRTTRSSYRLGCSDGHSYQVRVKAVSPAGVSSDYSESSILFICDRESPRLTINPLPSPGKVRFPSINLTGSFAELHLDELTVNGSTALVDYQAGTFTAPVSLAQGSNTIYLTARDLAGNVTTEKTTVTYAPLTITSLPMQARIYWGGNYAYAGLYSGMTPQSYSHAAGQQKKTLRISLPGFQDYCEMVDFADLSRDTYLISLVPHVPASFTEMTILYPSRASATGFTRSHPFVVDFNLDGNIDLLVGTADGTIALFLSLNDEEVLSQYALLRAGGSILDVGENAAPFMLDYDNDGSADLLAGNAQGSIFYYRNIGTNAEPVFSTERLLTDMSGTPITAESDSTPCPVDWNADNRKDLLLGSGSGDILLYLNEGTDDTPLYSTARMLNSESGAVHADSSAAPFVIDWNADGEQDLLVGGGDGAVHVYYGIPGRPEATLLTSPQIIELNGQPLMPGMLSVPFPLDLNHDGSFELIMGSADGSILRVN